MALLKGSLWDAYIGERNPRAFHISTRSSHGIKFVPRESDLIEVASNLEKRLNVSLPVHTDRNGKRINTYRWAGGTEGAIFFKDNDQFRRLDDFDRNNYLNDTRKLVCVAARVETLVTEGQVKGINGNSVLLDIFGENTLDVRPSIESMTMPYGTLTLEPVVKFDYFVASADRLEDIDGLRYRTLKSLIGQLANSIKDKNYMGITGNIDATFVVAGFVDSKGSVIPTKAGNPESFFIYAAENGYKGVIVYSSVASTAFGSYGDVADKLDEDVPAIVDLRARMLSGQGIPGRKETNNNNMTKFNLALQRMVQSDYPTALILMDNLAKSEDPAIDPVARALYERLHIIIRDAQGTPDPKAYIRYHAERLESVPHSYISGINYLLKYLRGNT